MPSALRPSNYSRISMNMQSNLILNNIRGNSNDLLQAQDRLTSGYRIGRPSDSPGEATTIMNLDNKIERFDQFIKNMAFANDIISSTDHAIGQSVNLISEAAALALEDADDAGLEANSVIIDSILDQLVSVGNTQTRGQFIFGGQNGTVDPFEPVGNGVLYHGSRSEMKTQVSFENDLLFTTDGSELFGATSSQVIGIADLNPDITTDTLLSDLDGALNEGIRLSSIVINDGANPATTIDLSGAVTIGDVVQKINTEAPLLSAFVNAAGNGIQITGGVNFTISEVGNGFTARDLGIEVTGGGPTVIGQDVDARLSLTTPVTALAGGAGIDTASGLLITNSAISGTGPLDISTANTLEDIINVMNTSSLSIRAEINASGDGINVYNLLSGSELSIGENGGTTATDLGIRSFVGTTNLSEFNNGKGVHVTGQDGKAGVIRVTDRTGAVHDIDLSTATTVQDVLNLINAGTGGAVTAALNSTGNGILLTNTAGPVTSNLSVATISTNGYDVAAELGIAQSVSANTINGTDTNQIEPEGVFSHLIALRDAMLAADRVEIARITKKLKEDETRFIKFHGEVGAQHKALEDREIRMQDNIIALQELRSDIRDIDFAEAVTRYQNIFTALQANMSSAGQINSTTLLDFLR